MTPQELKNSILQLAIQGKLVEQRPEEGTAEELYHQIQTEKQALIKAGKIKKEKPLPEIAEDEKPFDIPESWKWVRLSNISTVITKGTTPRGGNVAYLDRGVGFLRAENVAGLDHLDKTDLKCIDEETHYGYLARSVLQANDILITIAGTLGRTALVREEDLPLNANQAVSMVRLVNAEIVDLKYLIYSLNATSTQKALTTQKKVTAIPNLTLEIISMCTIPLPPLSEQKRIVAKIEELLPLIDRYEEAWTKLEEFNKRFPGDMQKSLLQMAIQGKLVEQRPEEGTGEELYQKIQTEKQALIKSDKIKKDKPLPEIADDEKPFDIPESWKWVRWGEIVNIVSARRVHQSDWKSDGIPFYRAREIAKLAENGCVENELFISQDLFDEFSKSGVPQAGDLMVTAVGTLGKTYIVKSEDHFYYKDASVICFENFAGMLPEYLKYVMQSEMMKNQIKSNSDGTTVATLTMVRTVEYVLPLPPLDEQKRIVAKLEELLPLCEGLK